MSVLETPRILFSGQIAWDPIVTNNNEPFYNEDTSSTVFPQRVEDIERKVAEFRAEAIAAVDTVTTPDGIVKWSWNPDGTHRSSFFNSSVSGADHGQGGDLCADPFVAAPVNFLGMLVDLEPYGAYTSQLFFDAMSLGIAGGCRIAARRSTRMTARYINFNRNPIGWKAGGASVVFQTCFGKNDLEIDAFNSPTLQALQKALEDDDVLGLTVQFNAYRTVYYDCPEIATNHPGVPNTKALDPQSAALIAKLTGGGFQPNPARSMMVGVAGLWRTGEPVNEPCDRVLLESANSPVATAHARLTGDSVTLDLSNSISETGLDLVKQDLGDLTVVAIDRNTEKLTKLATFGYAEYDRTAYLRTSGIVTLKVDPATAAAAASMDLQLINSENDLLLDEAALRVLPLVPNLYMSTSATALAEFQVYDRGVPAGGGIEVTFYVMRADGTPEGQQFKLTTTDQGRVRFTLAMGGGGRINAYVSVPGPNPVAPTADGIDPQVNTYLYVRVLPADKDIALLPATWENVYTHVLANWKAMAPCMDNWLDLSNEAQIRSFGPMIKRLTDKAAFENYRYMPVTRDLTEGQRTLLYNFLDNAAPSVTSSETVATAPTFAERSRLLRG